MTPTSGTMATSPKGQALNAALVRLAAQGVRPRCGEYGSHPLWLSEKPEERALAASWCTGCPVLVECGQAGAEYRANFGVWGGRDRTRRAAVDGGVGRQVTRQNRTSTVANTDSPAASGAVDTALDTSGHPARSIRTATTNRKEN